MEKYRRWTAVSLVVALLAALIPVPAGAVASGPPVPNYTHPVSCQSWALSQPKGERKSAYVKCVKGRKMTKRAKRCWIGAGIGIGGALVGGFIGAATARAIAGGVVAGSGTGCIGALV